ncbi:hypothetical protein CCACVL1_25301 [Corchorus capsularis]|uniref:Uncharacterized protein n=1 Tax=Corchorus capsularis TaxID=210143 RepID=A0A1R3GLE4_COCAP|nr:hypothetical protein CCACVL1_25301 [Corchorus capsularis]
MAQYGKLTPSSDLLPPPFCTIDKGNHKIKGCKSGSDSAY